VKPPFFSLRLDDESIPWRTTSHPGVSWHVLNAGESGSDQPQDAAVLIRMSPGSGYPPHRHLGSEDVLILQGSYQDELGVHTAGTFLRYPAGSSHEPVACGDARLPESSRNPACILFAIARGGVQNL
jgi:anti-sigma factor ChrR (cupin superfamily)